MLWNFHGKVVYCSAAVALWFLAGPPAEAQLRTFSRQELIDYIAKNPFDRLPDGRPKVPDDLLERARKLSAEDIWATVNEKEGYRNQYADGFQIVPPGKPLVGRAFTVQFMPLRADVGELVQAKAREHGQKRLMNQTAIGMSSPVMCSSLTSSAKRWMAP